MKCKKCGRDVQDGSAFCNWCGAKILKAQRGGDMVIPRARQLASGTWHIQLRLGGESISVTADTESKCKRLAAEIKEEYRHTKKLPASVKKTIGEAIDDYINSRDNVVSPSTIMGYKSIRRCRFKDIMDKPISEVKDWQSVLNAEAAGCSSKTVKNAWGLLKSAVEAAGGTVGAVTKPQIIKSERPFLDPDEIYKFIEIIRDTDIELPALLALHGLRRSELLALTWDNIDLKAGRILVKGAMVPNESYKLIHKAENKTTDSQRYVPIMIDRLKELVPADAEGVAVDMHPSTIFKHINKLCQENELPEIGFHGLRHSFASLAYHLEIPEETAMKIGGWSDYGTMRRIYVHLANKDLANHEMILKQFYNKNANKNANKKD